MYPKDKNELQKFIDGVIISLHNDKMRPKIMQQLTSEQVPVPARIGNVVSQVITAMLYRVQTQAGRKPHIQLLLNAIRMTVKEVSMMAEIAGVKVTDEDKRNAAKIAGDMIESGQQQGQQQATPQDMQGGVSPSVRQQGLVQGAM